MNDKLEFNIEETRDLSECMTWVENYMCSGPEGKDPFKEWLKKEESNAVLGLHHGFGTFIRNTLQLWHDGPAVKWFNERGIYHADDMSSIIFTSLYRDRNRKGIHLQDQIDHYREYWEKTNPDVNKGIK